MASNYPNGIYSPGSGPSDNPEVNDADTHGGNDPSFLSGAWLEMSERWQPVKVCMGGTQEFREHAAFLLPQEPREDYDAWRRRVSHAVLSPFMTRIADQAAGLICRKPITLKPRDEDGEVDPYWEDVFCKDVDGYGTDIDGFARRVVLSSLLMGHSAILCDFPSTEPAPNLQVERELGLRPYWIPIRADQILGWRKDGDSPIAPIDQIRISEYVSEPLGAFGDRTIRQIRCLRRGSWQIWRKGEGGWALYQEGTTSLPVIPLAVTYSGKVSELVSTPPLMEVAQLNILHAQRQADLQHSLHVAAQPIMYLKAWDDTDSTIGLSANSAILLPSDGEVGYAEPASSAFESQQSFITELEQQMENLGISTLFHQTYAAETAEAKALNRTDSDSMLSVVAQDLEQALQNAIDIAGMYLNKEAPLVHVDREFDLQSLDHQQISEYQSLYSNGVITHETLLTMLKEGSVLPDIDVEAEVEAVETSKLSMLDLGAAGGSLSEAEEQSPAQSEDGDSEVRQLVAERLRRLGQQNSDEES